MKHLLRLVGQAATWIGLAALVVALGYGPAFAPVPDGHGELKISLAHLSERLTPCRVLTEEERQALPPTRRVTEVCERGRVPTLLQVRLDGELLIDRSIKPAGWRHDGRAYLVAFYPLPAGRYQLELALRDTPRDQGFDMERNFSLNLEPGDSALLEIGDGDVTLRF